MEGCRGRDVKDGRGGLTWWTDVVDLPDILLPAGQYLDLFDSESETDVPSDSSDEELVEV